MFGDPDLLEELSCRLDRRSSWRHLAKELQVDPQTCDSFEQHQLQSPTDELFSFCTLHDLNVGKLKSALSKIDRTDVVIILDKHQGTAYVFVQNKIMFRN